MARTENVEVSEGPAERRAESHQSDPPPPVQKLRYSGHPPTVTLPLTATGSTSRTSTHRGGLAVAWKTWLPGAAVDAPLASAAAITRRIESALTRPAELVRSPRIAK